MALRLLLGAELDAEIRHLALAALTVLAGAIFAAVDRALRAAPDVFTHPAVEFILGALALRHCRLQYAVCRRISAVPGSHHMGIKAGSIPYATAARSEEHTSELQSLMRISYAVFCLKKKKTK